MRPNRYVHVRPSNPFRLIKQKLFGSPVHLKRIQFEWPTEKIFELMPDKESLCIESLTFQANEHMQFISVQCKLSNGMNSPVYKSLMSDTPQDQITSETILLPNDRPVCIVNSNFDTQMQSIMSISFNDTHSNRLGLFFPKKQDTQKVAGKVKKISAKVDIHAEPDTELLEFQQQRKTPMV